MGKAQKESLLILDLARNCTRSELACVQWPGDRCAHDGHSRGLIRDGLRLGTKNLVATKLPTKCRDRCLAWVGLTRRLSIAGAILSKSIIEDLVHRGRLRALHGAKNVLTENHNLHPFDSGSVGRAGSVPGRKKKRKKKKSQRSAKKSSSWGRSLHALKEEPSCEYGLSALMGPRNRVDPRHIFADHGSARAPREMRKDGQKNATRGGLGFSPSLGNPFADFSGLWLRLLFNSNIGRKETPRGGSTFRPRVFWASISGFFFRLQDVCGAQHLGRWERAFPEIVGGWPRRQACGGVATSGFGFFLALPMILFTGDISFRAATAPSAS